MFKNLSGSIEFGIIGLGRFGTALAKSLAEAGKEVLVIDNNENKIKQIRSFTDNAFIIENLEKDVLEETGIQYCDTVIVCIGEKVDVSILTTLNVINMGVRRVISKAFSYEQGQILQKIGAEVVYPENDMAIRLAKKLTSTNILDSIELIDDIEISELELSKKISNKTVLDSKIRQKFNLNIIVHEHNGTISTNILPTDILHEKDKIVVVGKKEDISRFEEYLSGM